MTLQKPLKLIPPASKTGTPHHDLLDLAIRKASDLILSHQAHEGYWWYTLEANESINAEYILLTHFLDVIDKPIQGKLAQRIQNSQQTDGSWPLYYQGSGDISTTIECYLALKLAGYDLNSPVMMRARNFILENGGISTCRVFTRIHLAQFGLIPWDTCPSMPVSFIHLPGWMPLSVYEFSSWARACIIPLLVIMHVKKVRPLMEGFNLNELYVERFPGEVDWSYKVKNTLSYNRLMLEVDKLLHVFEKWNLIPFKDSALKKSEQWIVEHINRTEDIYPALAYGAMALASLGHGVNHPTIQKALTALKSFQMPVSSGEIPPVPPFSTLKGHFVEGGKLDPPLLAKGGEGGFAADSLYQQCCISPVWDTPWAGMALLDAGESPSSTSLLKSGRWLISKQIRDVYGDWAVKNKKVKPGGWSFEFQNDYFPDVDDTIEVLAFLKRLDLRPEEVHEAFSLGVDWLLSMQSKNGGWAAFDVDNTLEVLNQIPFSDHGACLDPPTPDITGRMLEFLASIGYSKTHSVVKKAIRFVEKSQGDSGAWEGRWGVNYIYGTWCVLQGFQAIGYDMNTVRIQKAVKWLKSVQRADGGFGESCHSYIEKNFIPLPSSTASQTAWALMGLIAAGEAKSKEAQKAFEFLLKTQNDSGGWDEKYHTGTGFPGHFYIRYHGYRYYFPLLALGRYRASIAKTR